MDKLPSNLDRTEREKIETLLLLLESKALSFSAVAPNYETLFSSSSSIKTKRNVGIELAYIVAEGQEKRQLKPRTRDLVMRALGFQWKPPPPLKYKINYAYHIALMAAALTTTGCHHLYQLRRILFLLEKNGISLSQLMPHSNNGNLHALQEYFDALALESSSAYAVRPAINLLFGFKLAAYNLRPVKNPKHRNFLDSGRKAMSPHARNTLSQFLAFLENRARGDLPDMIDHGDMTPINFFLTKAIQAGAVRPVIYKVLADHFGLDLDVDVSTAPPTLADMKNILLLHHMHDALGTEGSGTFRRILWLIESKQKPWDAYVNAYRQVRDESSAQPDSLLCLQNLLGIDSECFPPDAKNVLDLVLERSPSIDLSALRTIADPHDAQQNRQ